MAKREKTLRVLMRRGTDVRELLQISRMSDETYQATAPGEIGHRSYKESGRLHTKFKPQGASHNRDWYGDIRHIPPPDELVHAEPLETFTIDNDPDWFSSSASPLKPYSGRGADKIVEIDTSELPTSCVIGAAVGVVGTGGDNALDAHSASMCGDIYEEIRREIVKTAGPALFCLVVGLKDGVDLDRLPEGTKIGVSGAFTRGTASRTSGSHKMRHGQHFAILSARPLFGDNPNSPYLVAAGPRLEMCTCKSGRRFKHCHGRAEAPTKSLASWSYPTLVITENDEGNWLISVEPAPLT